MNRFLALLGVGSRRACDEIILSGRVTVNGQLIKTPGLQVLPGETTITVDGRPVAGIRRPIVLLLNKPQGVVSTAFDPMNRPTVVDLCKLQASGKRLFPVGRLDINTTGAIPDGLVKEYYENGAVLADYYYKDGKLEGTSKGYFKNGIAVLYR